MVMWNNSLKFLFIIVIGAAVFWVLAAIVSCLFGFAIDDKDIVLTFVGIIATFVVVSNYVQLADMRNEFETKINELNEKIKDFEKYASALLYFLLAKFEALLVQNKIIEAYDFFFDNYSKEFENATLDILRKHFGGMYIGFKKSDDEKKMYREKYNKNLEKAERLGVSDDFKDYMKRAFLSDGTATIMNGT